MSIPPSQPQKTGGAMKTILIVLGIVVGCAVICCCGGGGYLWFKGKQAVNKVTSGEHFSMGGLEFNAKLPDNIPAYPGAKQKYSMGAKGEKGGGEQYFFTSSDPTSKVTSFYHDKLVGAGWKQASTQTTPNGTMSVYAKGKEQVDVLATTESNGETTIAITHVISDKAIESGATAPTEPAPQ